MKKSILHILVMIFLIAGEVFSGSVITQRVVNACGFIKGSSTLNLSGQVNYNFLSSSWDGIPMAIYNSLDNYLVMPTLFPRTNKGFGGKTATRNVSVNTSNGKFKWKEKDVKAYFSFSTGEERITPNKAVFKSKGTIDTSKLSELENKKLTIFDKRCSDQGSNYFASLTFFPESKKNKYSYSYNNGGIQAKISINSKFKAKAKFILSPEVAYPVILDSEHIFTNKYDYSLAIVGDGDVSSGFVGPDKVEFRVTENNGKFRYFSYNGTKVTNDFLMLELEDDTEVQAVFGTYDISLNVIGNGSASFEFTGPDEVELTVTKNKDKFRHFAVNGEKWANSEMKFSMQEDTIVEAVFGNYDLNVTVSGRGSVSCEFLKPDEVVVTALSNDGFFNSFQWDENISFKNPLKLTLTKNTELIVVFKIEYMVIDISGGPSAKSYPISYLDDVPEGGWTEEYRTTKLVLRKIEPGTFIMGSPEDELGRFSRETSHEVTLTNAYYIGVFETTQRQYRQICGLDRIPSSFIGGERPVECVSYDTIRGNVKGAFWPANSDVDPDSFLGILRAKTNQAFDLPTEAQWEYACRAGTTTALNNGKNLTGNDPCNNLNEVARYFNNGGGYLDFNGAKRANGHNVVGSYLPNAWGLYDMHGNVYEWCLDRYQEDLGNDPTMEPLGPSGGVKRVIRGGSWYDDAIYCRSAYRDSMDPDDFSDRLGFRVVLVQNVFSDPDNQIQKDFEFEIEPGTENTLPIFQTKFYGKLKNGTERLLEEMGRLEYDGASGIVAGVGKHKLTWFPDAAYTNVMDEVELRVEYKDVTEQANYLVLDTTNNKMRVSPNAPDTTDDKCRTDELWLKRIEPGTFTMGSPEDELGRDDDETQHQVTLTKAYYIGVFETTQKQCENIMGVNPSEYKGDLRPVDCCYYNMLRGADKGSAWPNNSGVDEYSFIGQLRRKAGNIFDLPTEAQWEYACRAGTTTALNSGKNLSEDEFDEMAEVGRYWYNGSVDEDDDGKFIYIAHAKVGSYLPNAWGLYDMHGNVWEWCLDWYASYNGDATDPKGGTNTLWFSERVFRGGSWYDSASNCRSACRGRDFKNYNKNDIGFRLVIVNAADNRIPRDFEFDIEFETENTLPIFQVKFYGKLKNGSEKLLEEMGKLENDGASGIVVGTGKHKLTWLPDEVYLNIMDEVELRVEYEDVTEQANYLVLDTTNNKMRVSPEGPDTANDKCRTDELWLRRIEPGRFSMGSNKSELGRRENEGQHKVTLTKAYYIGVFEMTQKQFHNIMGTNPSNYKGDLRPVSVSYYMLRGEKNGIAWPKNNEVDEESFIGQLRTKAGNIFDLPTEAQWEYACRAGTTTALNSGKDLSDADKCGEMAEVGRYKHNQNDGKGGYSEHTKVGSYLPNAWGLYDMHGNASEWCLDWYKDDLYSETDPKGTNSGTYRVLRGGGWSSGAERCRSASRYSYYPNHADNGDFDFGFRVVLVNE